MKFSEKSKIEKLFIIGISVFTICFIMLCLSSCSGSCLGCSYGCESNENYNLGGISYLSEGCCSSSSCQTAVGTIDTNEENADVSDMAMMSCTKSSGGCGGDSSCYTGCFVGKDVDCGDCGITFGTTDGDEVNENTIGCVNGCISCGGDAEMGFLYKIIYYLLGI